MDDRQDQNGKMLLLPFTSFLLSKDFSVREERKPRIHSEKTGEANTKSSITHRDFILFYFIFWVVLFFKII